MVRKLSYGARLTDSRSKPRIISPRNSRGRMLYNGGESIVVDEFSYESYLAFGGAGFEYHQGHCDAYDEDMEWIDFVDELDPSGKAFKRACEIRLLCPRLS